MPETYVRETVIVIDHELNEARADTTVRAMATLLTRYGFEEVGDARALPYRRFRGQADQIWPRSPKGQRKVGGAARKSVEAKKRRPRTPATVDLAA